VLAVFSGYFGQCPCGGIYHTLLSCFPPANNALIQCRDSGAASTNSGIGTRKCSPASVENSVPTSNLIGWDYGSAGIVNDRVRVVVFVPPRPHHVPVQFAVAE
jgi:hypothetical protein